MVRAALAFAFVSGAFAQSSAPKDLQIFLLIGQSNMAGRGTVEPVDRTPIPRVFTFNEKLEWVPAIDPLHWDKPAVAGVGIGRSFARYLADQNRTASIGLVPAAFGGSALNEWEPGGKHYNNAIERTRAAVKSGKLRGILWHQGEADSKADLAGSYRERFSKFIARLREDLDAKDVPVVVGQLGGFFQPDSAFARAVNEQLALVPLIVAKSAFVSSAGLKHKGDNVHFDSPSLREFGRRYALAYLSLDPGWAPPPGRETPPDVRAYAVARSLSDPEKKIAALEKFKTDFPASPMAEQVDEQIVSTLLKKLPEQKARIRAKAKSMYAAAEPARKGRTAANLAESMLEAGVLLEDAAKWAQASIKPLNEARYLAEQRAAAERRKQKPDSDDDLRKRYRELRAGRTATLGRICLKRGQTAKGKKLLEGAWAASPTLAPVATALGELAAKAGDEAKALDYFIIARLSGKASADHIKIFEALYRKRHNGSLDDLDATLDAEYRKRFPNPVHAEPYRRGPKANGRVVLAEVFTGAGCPPCVAADLAFDVVLERYSRQDVAVLMYHQHIPRPDPMTNPDTRERAKDYSVRGVPTFVIDGKPNSGGGYREHTPESYKRIEAEIQKAIGIAPEARLSARAALDAGVVTVHASADSIQSKAAGLKLRIALVEKELRYTGENGVRFHPMVVRALAGHDVKPSGGAFDSAFDLAKIAAANGKHLDEFEKTGRDEPFQFLEKKHQLHATELAAVVFLEDPAAHRILQAHWVDLAR
jgi:hypothetical protein